MATISTDTPTNETLLNENVEPIQLLILDINGILCKKVPKQPQDKDIDLNYEHIDLPYYNVYLRKGVRKFLNWCYQQYTVAFWSSTTHKNAEIIINHILTVVQREKTHFFWYRDHTQLDPDYGKDPNVIESDTIKLLSRVVSHPSINLCRRYSYNNILLLDDTMMKTRFNFKKNILTIPTFDPYDKKSISMTKYSKLIHEKFDSMNNNEDTDYSNVSMNKE